MKSRVIGIRHRVKKTADGESRPTQVVIIGESRSETIELKTEDDELDFIRYVLEKGDRIAMVLGGSGDSLAYALSRAGEEAGVRVFRIPAFQLMGERGEASKDEDAKLLAETFIEKPDFFYEVRTRDRGLIEVSECYRARQEAMMARMACEQRLRQNFIGRLFRQRDGLYPEGVIEDLFNAEKATNVILGNLEKEQGEREKDLTKALKALDVYNAVFDPIEGCGMSVAAGIIAAVGDIRRFETMAKFKAFLGVHTLTKYEDGVAVNPKDGAFPRRRRNQTSNWNPAGRQAMYNFGDQMHRRKESIWGLRYRDYKVLLREKHPVVELTEAGKKRYTDGHIHKMATWKALGKFAEFVYREWWKLEGGTVRSGKVLKDAA